MVNNVINGTYVETYDLKTTVGSMAILGIHTPTASSLKKMYKGLFEQYKKIKINGCDIVGVCASTQALTPAEVGLEAGLVDPRDVLNPILFKACTGENLDLLLDRVYSTPGQLEDIGSIHREDTNVADELGMYYTYLADDSFRKFHPQGGIRVGNLKPFVHRVATTQPFKWDVGLPKSTATASTDGAPVIGGNNGAYALAFGGSDGTPAQAPSVFISNGLEPMPWIETTFEGSASPVEGNSVPVTAIAASIPRIYCGVIILPPAIVQPLYFRFSIRWHISFKDFRPAYEIGPISETVFETEEGSYGGPTGPLYYNLYNVSSKLDASYGSFDVNGSDSVEVVNEKAL